MLSRRSSPIVLAHGCRQNNTIANLCVAAYDMVKGGRDFGYSDSVRYMFSGDRSVVVAPLVALVAFTKKSRWITAGDGDSGKGSFDEFHDWGSRHVSQAVVESMIAEAVPHQHVQVGPKSLMFWPGTWYCWEELHSHTAGCRDNLCPRLAVKDDLQLLADHLPKDNKCVCKDGLQDMISLLDDEAIFDAEAKLAEGKKGATKEDLD